MSKLGASVRITQGQGSKLQLVLVGTGASKIEIRGKDGKRILQVVPKAQRGSGKAVDQEDHALKNLVPVGE